MNYKIAQLSVSPEQKTDIINKIIISQPSAEQENLLGRLFIILEFKTKNPEMIRLANYIIEQTKKNYYKNEQIILLEKTASIKVENIFESAIAKLNQDIVEFLQTEKVKFSPVNVNITLGVIYQNELHFANLGRNKSLLLYQPKNTIASDKKQYDIMNVGQKTTDPTQEVFNINKLFSNIINGSIPVGSYFVFTNEALYEYLSEKQLIEIITTLPPASAVEQIKNILQQTNVYVPFLGLIIKNGRAVLQEEQPRSTIKATQTAPLPARQPAHIQTDRSESPLEVLSETEEKTAKILNPTGFINLRKFKNLVNRFDLRKWKKLQNRNTLKFKKKLAITRKISPARILNIIQMTIGFIISGSINIAKTITNKKKLGQIKQKISAKKKRLTKRHLIMLIIIILVIAGFIANLMIVGIKNKRLAQEQEYQDKIELINQKQGQIETALLYNNIEEARSNLTQITQLLDEFPQNTEQQKIDYQELKTNYNQKFDELNNVTRLNPDILASLANKQADNLIIVNGLLYLADNNDKVIYEINLNNPEPKTVAQDNLIKNLSLPAVDDNNNIYYLSSNNSIIAFDPSSQQLTKLESTELPDNIEALTVFNNRIYLFDQQDRQIYRYNRYSDNLANQRGWLKGDELRQINSMSIDGYVYLIADNTIYKYGGGNRQDFDLENIYPALTAPQKLITLQNYELIYVLETKTNRLIIFNKGGKFLAQYTSDLFQEITDFTVNETNGTVYLLDRSTIYQFPVWSAN